MGIKTSELSLVTSLDIKSAARVVNQFFAQEKADVEPIIESNNPLDALEGQSVLSVVGSRQGRMNQWAVQVYFDHHEKGTQITLVAIGHSGMSRAFTGTRYTASLSKSVGQMEKLFMALNSADPGIIRIS